VEGEGLGRVRWRLVEFAVAATQDRAERALDELVPGWSTAGDSVRFDIPAPADGVYRNGDLTLGVPFGMDVDLETTTDVHVSDLTGTLSVRCGDSASVERHAGSCDVAAGRGGLGLEVAVPDSGYCLARTGEGDIVLRLPPTASARLTARTGHGIVTVSGLTLAGRIDGAGYVSGTLGAGLATVDLQTARGNITVVGAAAARTGLLRARSDPNPPPDGESRFARRRDAGGGLMNSPGEDALHGVHVDSFLSMPTPGPASRVPRFGRLPPAGWSRDQGFGFTPVFTQFTRSRKFDAISAGV
jgi:hypothetical protein